MKYIKEYNQESSKKWFFGKDQDSHSYMIPFELHEKWIEMTINDIDDDDDERVDEFEKIFSKYMINSIYDYVFDNPKKI